MSAFFGVQKFRKLLLAGSFTVLANYIVRLSDSLIAGHLFGADALAGVNLVGPFLSAVSFVAGLVATGVGTNYSLSLGRCDKGRACQFFVQGVWSVLFLGGLLALAGVLFCDSFIGFFGALPSVERYAADYLGSVWPVAILEGILMLMVTLGYADGDTRLCSLGYAVVFIANVVASVLGVKAGFGTAGCAIGSVIADTLGILVLSLHFFKESNSFKLVSHFSCSDTARIVSSSFGDAAAFLCDGLLFLFLNKYVIQCYGPEILPVVAVVTTLWGFLELFNGIGVAIQPIVSVYYGEGNVPAVRLVMRSAMRIAALEGVVVAVAFALFPSEIVRLVGIDQPELLGEAVLAVRWISIGFVALAMAGLFNSYYMFIEKSALAGCVTFFCYLIMPVGCVAGLAMIGRWGVWAGLGAGPLLGVLGVAIVVISVAGREGFPLLLPKIPDGVIRIFSLELTDEEIAAVSAKVGAISGVPMKAALLVEEVFEVVKDRNQGRRVFGEVTIDLSKGVRLTLRDDGEIFDITDADARVSSLRSYLVSSMMRLHEGKMNLVTTGFNRNVFHFT